MKMKHSWNINDWKKLEDDRDIEEIHENMKVRHKEPPWVACPYCGEKL